MPPSVPLRKNARNAPFYQRSISCPGGCSARLLSCFATPARRVAEKLAPSVFVALRRDKSLRWAQGKTAMRPCRLDLSTVRQGSIASGGWIAEEGRVLRRPLGGLRKNLRLRFAGRKGKPQCAPVGWIWQLSDKVRLQPADAVRGKVGFCDEHGAGVYYVLDCSGAGARREIFRNAPPDHSLVKSAATCIASCRIISLLLSFSAASVKILSASSVTSFSLRYSAYLVFSFNES